MEHPRQFSACHFLTFSPGSFELCSQGTGYSDSLGTVRPHTPNINNLDYLRSDNDPINYEYQCLDDQIEHFIIRNVIPTSFIPCNRCRALVRSLCERAVIMHGMSSTSMVMAR